LRLVEEETPGERWWEKVFITRSPGRNPAL
jgi:hypothetical protein